MTKMMMEITAAKMGRLMKKLEIFMRSWLFPRFRIARLLFVTHKGGLRGCLTQCVRFARHGNLLGCDNGSGTDALQSADDDDVAPVQAITHDAQSLRHRAKFHGAILKRVVLAEHKHVFLIQVRNDGLVFCQAATAHPASL